MNDLRVTRENARFQQWEALLTNRSKRHRTREFLVQGVRPITRAVEEGWTVRALLRADGTTSGWADDLWSTTDGEREHVAVPDDAGDPGLVLGVLEQLPGPPCERRPPRVRHEHRSQRDRREAVGLGQVTRRDRGVRGLGEVDDAYARAHRARLGRTRSVGTPSFGSRARTCDPYGRHSRASERP